jgi:hypothetical protein
MRGLIVKYFIFYAYEYESIYLFVYNKVSAITQCKFCTNKPKLLIEINLYILNETNFFLICKSYFSLKSENLIKYKKKLKFRTVIFYDVLVLQTLPLKKMLSLFRNKIRHLQFPDFIDSFTLIIIYIEFFIYRKFLIITTCSGVA